MVLKRVTIIRGNEILTKNGYMAKTLFERTKGLLGKNKTEWPLKNEDALVLSPCHAVHTFFMKFSIDVVFLNKKGVIVSLYPSLPPFRMSGFHGTAKKAIELPSGTIEKWHLRIGEELHIRGER